MHYEAHEIDDDTLARAAREALTLPSDFGRFDDRLYRTHGPVMSWAERGDDILEESNYLTVLEHLQGTAGATEHEDRACCWDGESKIGYGTEHNPHDDDVEDSSVGHWLVGSLRQIIVRVFETHCRYCDTAVDRTDSGLFLADETEDEVCPGPSGWHEADYTDTFRESVAVALSLQDYPVFDESDFSEREWSEYERQLADALDDARSDFDRAAWMLSESAAELTDEEHKAVCELVYESASNDEEGVRHDGPNVDYDGVSKVYARHADALLMNAWEAYARYLDNPNGDAQLTLV